MSIKIDWPQLGLASGDGLQLYYSNSRFDRDNLPATKYTLDPTINSYVDTGVPANTLRYYMLEASKAGFNTQYSQCMVMGNFASTGPGNQTILRGNWERGYFGTLPTSQLFTPTQLRTACGATGLGAAPADSSVTLWHKFAYKGKILFIPHGCMTTINNGAVSWASLYNLGLVYGTDDFGNPPFDLVATTNNPKITAGVNQKKVVTSAGGDDFLVRLPKCSSKATNVYVGSVSVETEGGEWWDLMCMLTTNLTTDVSTKIPALKWSDYTGATPCQYAAFQHFTSNSYPRTEFNSFWGQFSSNNNMQQAPSGSNFVNWVPVLEYIPK